MPARRPIETEEPKSIEEARLWREALIQEIGEINLQLGNPDRKGPGGVRLSGKEYWTWRRSAIGAKFARETRLSYLKRWIRDHVVEAHAARLEDLNPHDPKSLLRAAYTALKHVSLHLPENERDLPHLIGVHLGIE